MSDTPKTDALREVIVGQYKEDELTGNGMGNLLAALTDIETLERERDAERALAEMYRRKYSRLTGEHEALQEQLDAAAKAVIDRWETPYWKEAAHTGAYIAALRKAVEIEEGGHL